MISLKKLFTISVATLISTFCLYIYSSFREFIDDHNISYENIDINYPYISIINLNIDSLKINHLKIKLRYFALIHKLHIKTLLLNTDKEKVFDTLKEFLLPKKHTHTNVLNNFLIPNKILIDKLICNNTDILDNLCISNLINCPSIFFNIPHCNNFLVHLNFFNTFSYCELFIFDNNKEIVHGILNIINKNLNTNVLIGKLNILNHALSIVSYLDSGKKKIQSIIKTKYMSISNITNYKNSLKSESHIKLWNNNNLLIKITKNSNILNILCKDTVRNQLLYGNINTCNNNLLFSSEHFYFIKSFIASYKNSILTMNGNILSTNFKILANIKSTKNNLSIISSNIKFFNNKTTILSKNLNIQFNKNNLSINSECDIQINNKNNLKIKSLFALDNFFTKIEIKNLTINNESFYGSSKLFLKERTICHETNVQSKDNFIKIKNLYDCFGFKISTPQSYIDIYLNNKKTFFEVIIAILKKQISVNGYIFLPEFAKIISDGKLTIDIKHNNSNGFYGIMELINLNIKDYTRGIILKNGYAKFLGEKNLFKIEKNSHICDKYKNIGTLSGKIEFIDILNFNNDINLLLKNFCLTKTSSLFLSANGILNMSGNIKHQKITGNLKTSTAYFHLLDTSNDFKNITLKNTKIKETDYKNSYINFDVNISTNNLKIIGENFEINLFGFLTLINSGNTIKGKLYAYKHKGFFEVLKQKLDIKSGCVIFYEKYPFNPIFELKTNKLINDIILQVNIKKDANDFNYTLSSIPEMSKENILAKILFNKTIDKLSSTDWIQIAYLTQINNIGLLKKLNTIEKKIGIDIKFEKNIDKEPGMLKLEKKLKNDISISVENNINNNIQEVRIKKPISKNILGEISTNGDIGISYKYRY